MDKSLKLLKNSQVQFINISDDQAGQRIDNFLITILKGVPKSKIYGIIRKGEIRVNKGRIQPSYRLLAGDVVRIPPIRIAETAKKVAPSTQTLDSLTKNIIFENEELIIINKPAGMAVHSGSTVRLGIIEALRFARPELTALELAHRLDADTSGCLILAKKKRVLREVHNLLRAGAVRKIYWTLTVGKWSRKELRVNLPLFKHYREGAKHMVEVNVQGKEALSLFRTLRTFIMPISDKAETLICSLMEVKLMTGRTHQIRVHSQAQHHPIAGDDRYGDSDFNKFVHHLGLRRMFLHAHSLDFTLPSTGQQIKVIAPLPTELDSFLNKLSMLSTTKTLE